MNRWITIISFFILSFISDKLTAQDILKIAEAKDTKRDTKVYDIKSLDGENQKVSIIPDYVNRVLKISCLKDTIFDNYFWGVPTDVTILDKTFLKISYEVRTGSGEDGATVIIVCVDKKRIYNAINVRSLSSYNMGDEHGVYKLKIAFDGNNIKTYKLLIKVHDDAYSNYEPSSNFIYNNLSVLHFDINRRVFYSLKQDIYGNLKMHDVKTAKEYQQHIGGNFPVIILGDEIYYFINGLWYQKGNDDSFSTYSVINKNLHLDEAQY